MAADMVADMVARCRLQLCLISTPKMFYASGLYPIESFDLVRSGLVTVLLDTLKHHLPMP